MKMKMNPPGYVATFGQGLRARNTQLGASGTKEWLKAIKLHKYWPLISHLSYWKMMGLTEENIEFHIKEAGGTSMTLGAKGRLLRYIECLRLRESTLNNLPVKLVTGQISANEVLSYILEVVQTPMPISEDEGLPSLLVHTFLLVLEILLLTESSQHTEMVEKIILRIQCNPVLSSVEANPVRYMRNFEYFVSGLNCSSNSVKCRIWPVESNTVMFQVEDHHLRSLNSIVHSSKDCKNRGMSLL